MTNKKFFLGFLFLVGIIHWLAFFYLTAPQHPGWSQMPEGPGKWFVTRPYEPHGFYKEWMRMPSDPKQWFQARSFDAHDWDIELNYHNILKEGVRTGTMPYHSPNMYNWALIPPDSNRFLGTPQYPLSPQIFLLGVLDPMSFIVTNTILLYCIGFLG